MPVTGFVGLPGSGKTLRLVQLTLAARLAGRDVFANFQLGRRAYGYMVPTCGPLNTLHLGWHHDLHQATGYQFRERTPDLDVSARRWQLRAGRGFIPDPKVTVLESWEQVLAIRAARDALGVAHRLRLVKGAPVETADGAEQVWTAEPACNVWDCPGCSKGITIALDELNLWAPSRFWKRLGVGVLNRWAYVRKDGLQVLWSAQHEARIDVVAREVTDFIWVCRSLGGTFNFLGRWPWHLQLFHRRKWVPAMLDDKNRTAEGEGAQVSGGLLSGGFEWARWGGMKAAADAYDTFEHVAPAAIAPAKAKAKRKRVAAVDDDEGDADAA